MRPLVISTVGLSSLLLNWVPAATLGAQDWPQFGGPQRNFTLEGAAVQANWKSWPPAGPREVWQRQLGDGFAGMVIAEGTLVTMFHQAGSETVIALDLGHLFRRPGRAVVHGNEVAPFGVAHRCCAACHTSCLVQRQFAALQQLDVVDGDVQDLVEVEVAVDDRFVARVDLVFDQLLLFPLGV